jgi:hypothetical protein
MTCEHKVGVEIFKGCDPPFELATNSKPEYLYIIFNYCPTCGEELVVCDVCGILRGKDETNYIDEDGNNVCKYCRNK